MSGERNRLLMPSQNASTIQVGDVLCGFIDPSVWAKEKQCLIPWGLVDAFSPFNPQHHLEDFPIG